MLDRELVKLTIEGNNESINILKSEYGGNIKKIKDLEDLNVGVKYAIDLAEFYNEALNKKLIEITE